MRCESADRCPAVTPFPASMYMQKSHADCEFSSSSAGKCNRIRRSSNGGLKRQVPLGRGVARGARGVLGDAAWPAQPCPALPCRVQSTSSTANATFCFPAINFDHALNPTYSPPCTPLPPSGIIAHTHEFFNRTFLAKSVERKKGQRGKDDESIRRVASFCGRERNSHMMSHYAIYWRLAELNSHR